MTPKELQQANIDRFEQLLTRENDLERREMLTRLLDEERHKDASCYPIRTGPRATEDSPGVRPV